MAEMSEREALSKARSHLSAGELVQAAELCERVVKRNKRSSDALQVLGIVASTLRRYDEAAECFSRCIRLHPKSPQFRFLLAKVHTFQGKLDEALKGYDIALKLDGGFTDAVGWKAATLERMGDHDRARSLLEPIVAAGKEDADMAEVWAKLEIEFGRPLEADAIIERHLARSDLKKIPRELLTFLRGRALEKAGEYDRAFEAYVEGNRLIECEFDIEDWIRSTDRIIEAYSIENLARLPRCANDTNLPVFIAGLPRSGTTLIEQIIDAHPLAHGASEIRDMVDIAVGLPGLIGSSKEYPACVTDLTQRAADNLGKRYLNRVSRLNRRAKRVVNKSIENYKLVGLISLVLPGAKVIHCKRDPLDNCFSCFVNRLTPLAYPYSTDLKNIGVAYTEYERLMRHWREVPGIEILDVSYEELISDQDRISRQIIEFCDLDWDDACLRYYESGRFAKTLSYDQVRRPIYSSSVGRWKDFERHLEPLNKVLAGA